MYLLTIFLPLFSSLTSGFFGRWLGFYGSSLLSLICLLTTLCFSFLIFFEVSLNSQVINLNLCLWLYSNEILISWNFLFDSLTSVMLIVVSLISFLVHLYSTDYMKSDPHFPRFISFLGIFTFFMFLLITSGNLLQLFLGWEGVGLASYLLINFWFTRLAANKAALKALIVNRIGDLGVLFAILLILQIFEGTLDFFTIFSLTPLVNNFYFSLFSYNLHYLSLVGFFLVIGAMGKSAQLGLHTWLPDAMEGPTPVSALIHAATMVTAGVFLIIRFSPLIEFSNTILTLLILLGSSTAFFAAFTGTFQHDLKKVIAYSTCSQLGYMIFCCGLSYYHLSLFHLFNHAFFKALLFLSAGSIIHAISNEQDMRRMGSLIVFLPTTYSLMLIGSLALIGFPFLAGFYSKDIILETATLFNNSNLPSFLAIFSSFLGILAAFFTSFYSFRLIFLTFLNNSNFFRHSSKTFNESSSVTLFVLSLLSLLSLFVGYFFKEFFLGMGTDSWNNSIFIWPNFHFSIESEFLPIHLKWLPFFFTFFGFLLAFLLNLSSIRFFHFLEKIQFIFFLINKKWFFDFIYNSFVVFPLINFGYQISYKNLDKGFIELAGPYGFSRLINKIIVFLNSLQTGQISHYIFFITFGFFFFMSCFIYTNLTFKLLIIFFIAIFYKF